MKQNRQLEKKIEFLEKPCRKKFLGYYDTKENKNRCYYGADCVNKIIIKTFAYCKDFIDTSF